jgi:hypothetical protein
VFWNTSIHDCILDFGRCSKFIALFLDLDSKLPRWSQYQNNRSLSGFQIRLFGKGIENCVSSIDLNNPYFSLIPFEQSTTVQAIRHHVKAPARLSIKNR